MSLGKSMEKIPAASAMEWSIELEKGLRSKKPGKSTEEISKIGSRLEQWSRESGVTVAECKMFDLIPAGCFCEVANDFACILLEILVNMLFSSEASRSLEFRLGVCRAFARMSCSFPVANRAYEVGLKLLLDSCEEKFSTVMLISRTKIASKWTVLTPGQIDLLLSFVAEHKALQIQATALCYLDFILERGLSSYPATGERIHSLFNILHDSKIWPALLYKALKV